MSNAIVHAIAVAELRSIVEGVESIESDIRDLNADKAQLYKDADAKGYDKKIIKKVVAARRMETAAREEQDALFQTYWDALHGASLVHARAHVEKIEQFSHSSVTPSPSQAVDEESRDAALPSVSAPSYGQD